MKYFIWLQDNTGIVAQIVYNELPKTGEGKLKPYLACYVIPDDDKRSIEELKQDFPYEAKS